MHNIPNLWHREMDFIDVVRDMEREGIGVDIPFCKHQAAIGEGTMNVILKELNYLKPTSPKDVEMLMRMAQLPVPLPGHKRTPAGKLSWDKSVMAEYEEIIEAQGNSATNIAQRVLEYRGWSKTVSSNYDAYLRLAVDGVLRTNFKIHGTKTTRLSAEDPALQQIPKETIKPWNGNLKKAFVPKRKGFVLLGRDYSQLEYRLGAGYAKQQNIIEAFNEPTRDVFSELAEQLGRPRNDVKTLMYAKGYGAGIAKLQLLLGEGALKFIKDWERKHNRMVALAEEVNRTAAQRGWIRLWTGRRRHFPFKQEARKGWNSLIQGGGAEIVKSAMIRCANDRDIKNSPDCHLVLQVHDELLFEVRESKLEYYDLMIKHLMEDVAAEIDFGVHFKTESKIWN